MASSIDWFPISKIFLSHIFLCTTFLCIVQDFEVSSVEYYLLFLLGVIYIPAIFFLNYRNNECKGDEESSENRFPLSEDSLAYISSATTLFTIIQDRIISRFEYFVLWMMFGLHIACWCIKYITREWTGGERHRIQSVVQTEEIQVERTQENTSDYTLAVRQVRQYVDSQLGDGQHRIRPDTREWQLQRQITIEKLDRLRAELDTICVRASLGRAMGYAAEIFGVLASLTAAFIESRQSYSSVQTLRDVSGILTNSGPIVQEAANVIEHSISRGFLIEVAEVLRRDRELSRPLQEWMTFSRNLEANVREIFGCSLNSPNLRNILKFFSEFTQNCNSGGGFRQILNFLRGGSSSIDIERIDPTGRLSSLRSQIESNPELRDNVQAICSSLIRSPFAIQDNCDGIRLLRTVGGEEECNGDRMRNSAMGNSNAVAQFSALQAVNLAANVFHMSSEITIIREGRSRYSDALQKVSQLLAMELRSVEALTSET